MQPEPPEFDVDEKATFKHIRREPEKTIFTRQVGTVTGIRWKVPFYEFTLQGDHVDSGRWYRQTELNQVKAGNESADCTAEAAVLAQTRSSLETARTESEHLRSQNEALSLSLTRQAADLATACALISDLGESEVKAVTARKVSDAQLLQAYQDIEAVRVEIDGLREQIATLSTAAKLQVNVQPDLVSARGHNAEFDKEAGDWEAMESKVNAIIPQLTKMTVSWGPAAEGDAK